MKTKDKRPAKTEIMTSAMAINTTVAIRSAVLALMKFSSLMIGIGLAE